MASLERVSALFDVVPEEHDGVGLKAEHLRGEVEFRNVSFSYNSRETVLDNVSFAVAAGEHMAVVGPSGVGKTTLVSLLLQFYRPQKGRDLHRRPAGGRIRAAFPAPAHRLRAPVADAAQRHHRRQPALRRPRSRRSDDLKKRPAPPASTTSSPRCPMATRPWSASAASIFPRGRSSAWPSPAPWSRTPISSSWTSRPRRWIRRPRPRSSPSCPSCCAARRCSSSPIA